MSGHLPGGAVRYPGHRWGCLVDDPWNPEVDRAVGDAWEKAVEQALALLGVPPDRRAALPDAEGE